MNLKNLMPILILSLFILTICAVSAADDVASENLTSTELEVDDSINTSINEKETLASEEVENNIAIENDPILSKEDPEMEIEVEDACYGENVTVTARLSNHASGNVTAEIGETAYTTLAIDGTCHFLFTGLNASNYIVTAKYAGDESYNARNMSKMFTVSKANSFITITQNDDTVTVNLTGINGSAICGATITVNVDDRYINMTTNSTGQVTLADILPYGHNNITATYSGNNNYLPSENTTEYYILDPTSFEALQQLIDSAGDTLTITQNYYGNGTEITITKDNFIINGNGRTLNANSLSRIFKITGKNVVLSNLFLINAASNSIGGAIYTEYTLATNNCEFINNTAEYGAAIFVDAKTTEVALSVNNCTFTNNAANQAGGAIALAATYGNDINYIINCSTFTNNSAINYGADICCAGGAVYMVGSAKGTIQKTKFSENKVDSQVFPNGGAIKVQFGAKATIRDCDFTANEVNKGAAVNLQSDVDKNSEVRIINCRFKNNKAQAGAIAASSNIGETILEIIDCEFENNLATIKGGAVYGDALSNITILNSKFTGNNATNDGGAIYVGGHYCNISNSNFTNNHAGNNGGSIYWEGNDGVLINAYFESSSANANGGAVYWKGERGCIENSNFLRSSATNGGAVYVEDNKEVLVKQSNFDRNHAEIGSAIYGGEYSNCAFSNNDNIVVYPTEKLDTTTIIGINKYSITLDESISIFFDVSSKNSAVEGVIDLYINDVVYTTANIGDVVTYTPPAAASYNIYARYNGDENYLGSKSNNKVVTVLKKDSKAIISYHDIILGENETVSVNLPSDATGSINITLFKYNKIIDNYVSNISSSVVKTQFSNLNFGSYTVNVQYSGDSKYKEFNRSVGFVVRPDVIITQNVTKGDDVAIFADLINDTGYATITIDGEFPNSVRFVDNKINYMFSTADIPFGNHTINIEYHGKNLDKNIFNTWSEENNEFIPKDFELYIAPVPQTTLTVVESTEDRAIVTVELSKDAKGTVKFFVDGIEAFVAEIVNGIATFDVSNYKNGQYLISWTYSGDDKYDSTSGNSTVIVHILPPIIVAGNLKMFYSSDKKYFVIVCNNKGNVIAGTTVTFLINNKVIGTAKTNSKGIAIIKISKTPGTYKITSKALGISTTRTLTVKHIISLKKVTVKRSAKKLVLTAKLIKGKGKITFRFNGKKIKTVKTNKKGVAEVTIKSNLLKKLKAGKTVTYQATYLKDTVKRSVKVKK